jgi:sialic acid synthase SpsE
MRIGSHDTQREVFIIAEVGGNHDGNVDKALALVDAAAAAGASAVKFQTYCASTLVHPGLEPMPHVRSKYKSQYERFQSLELPSDGWRAIVGRCARAGILFMTTPFDVQLLREFASHMPAIKIASGDLTYLQLIAAATEYQKPVILSTGMATLDEIDRALSVAGGNTALLHCVSIYPLPDAEANLLAIPVMRARWPQAEIGYSDHTVGVEACLAAVALGARIIEKHFTLDDSSPVGDHKLSLMPSGMGSLVRSIRRIEAMLGSPDKSPRGGEFPMRRWMRRGVYTGQPFADGRPNIQFLRPENGVSPADVFEQDRAGGREKPPG